MLKENFSKIYKKFLDFYNTNHNAIDKSTVYRLDAYKAVMTGLMYLASTQIRFNLAGLMYGLSQDGEFIGSIGLEVFTYSDLFSLTSWYNTINDETETDPEIKEMSNGTVEILLFEVADVENNYTKALERETKYYDIKDILTKKFLITKIEDNKVKLFVNTGQNYIDEIRELMEKEKKDDKGTEDTTLHPN